MQLLIVSVLMEALGIPWSPTEESPAHTEDTSTSACHPPCLAHGELCHLVVSGLVLECVLILSENFPHTYKGSGVWFPSLPHWQGLL